MIIYIILLLLVTAVIFLYKRHEGFGSSDGGALIQLYAKGPQDTYLTGDTEKYIPEYLYGIYPYGYYLWNIPTRYQSEYYPRYHTVSQFGNLYPLRAPAL